MQAQVTIPSRWQLAVKKREWSGIHKREIYFTKQVHSLTSNQLMENKCINENNVLTGRSRTDWWASSKNSINGHSSLVWEPVSLVVYSYRLFGFRRAFVWIIRSKLIGRWRQLLSRSSIWVEGFLKLNQDHGHVVTSFTTSWRCQTSVKYSLANNWEFAFLHI